MRVTALCKYIDRTIMKMRDPFDPFTTEDQTEGTVLKPNSGGRRPVNPNATLIRSVATSAPVDLTRFTALNPLVGAANPLLILVPQLRGTVSHSDLSALRANLTHAIKEFESTAHGRGIAQVTILTARYCLCALLDETIMAMPWAGTWGANSLLVTFHNDNLGGEKFFVILERALQDSRTNVDLLEFLHLCLSFGFQGRYRLTEGGRERLDEWRDRLYRAIRAVRGEFERELSPFWKGVIDKRNPLVRIVPLWVVGTVAGALLTGLYVLLSLRLNRESDPVLRELVSIPGNAFEPKPVLLPPPADPKLSAFLAPEIAQNLVRVEETALRAKVTIIGDGFFGSGSASISPAYLALIARIGAAMHSTPGHVEVVGHTDDRRMVSARFPSNWHLSEARAQEVMRLLIEAGNEPERFRAIGRGDAEPLVANDTPANRARNRRVEIIVSGSGSAVVAKNNASAQ